MEGEGERQRTDTHASQGGRNLWQPAWSTPLPPLPGYILENVFCILTAIGRPHQTGQIRDWCKQAVILQCSLLTPNWAWSPVYTWRQKRRTRGGQVPADSHAVPYSLREQNCSWVIQSILPRKAWSWFIQETLFKLCSVMLFFPLFSFVTWFELLRVEHIRGITKAFAATSGKMLLIWDTLDTMTLFDHSLNLPVSKIFVSVRSSCSRSRPSLISHILKIIPTSTYFIVLQSFPFLWQQLPRKKSHMPLDVAS